VRNGDGTGKKTMINWELIMKKYDLNIKSGGLTLNHQNMDLKVITGGLAIGNV
jgi:predicted secreted hydrolase